jgi:hypothetical protein
MRPPIRSESDAFRLTLGLSLLMVVSATVGALVEPIVGFGTFMAVVVIVAVVYVSNAGSDPRPTLREAADGPHPHGAEPGRRHVLVVANEVLCGDALREQIMCGGPGCVELDVLAPVLTSRVHLQVTDIDRELNEARGRLARSLAWARANGLHARGEVGDVSTTTAIEDELRDFGADEVIVVTYPRDRETWQERRELERLRRELDVPVTQIVVEEEALHAS